MDSIVMSCIKYLLFLFNLVFAVSGIVVLSIGITLQQSYSSYSLFIGDKLFSLPFFFILVGVFIFIVAFFGCCGAINESNYMLMTFAVLLCLTFVMEAAGGIAGYLLKDDLNEITEMRMNSSMKNYHTKIYADTWNALQSDFFCCGVNNYTDWYTVTKDLPLSCCPDTPMEDHCTEAKVSRNGCLLSLGNFLAGNIINFIAFGIAIAFVQFVGVFFACCMSRSIRKYETV